MHGEFPKVRRGRRPSGTATAFTWWLVNDETQELPWKEIAFNMTAGAARSLAAHWRADLPVGATDLI
jgi:hypothetical protein